MSRSKPTVVVLGTNHFNSPDNGDLFQPETQDILTQNKQQEIAEVIECLVHYNPTKIVLEVLSDQQEKLDESYQAFLQGKYSLKANERHQIGFKLGRAMNHEKLYAVDWNDQVDGIPDLEEWADTHGSPVFEEVKEKGASLTKEIETYFNNHSVREFLRWLNTSSNLNASHEIHMLLALIGDHDQPVGAMWTAQYWYYRNLIIYKNIVDLATSSNDRLFVLYGMGHVHLLTQFLQESGRFNVELVSDYL
ncbi:DUF5694 domain-containing protein [Alkalibacillus almallahensis]|uniref:DUF5694 domain-containing protein n=1 Tax=Alkalibacillus almallahensis TaxID=1379154 RepID=UPI00141FE58A|nr:DUF5694 domain-containing protein [Alkalibacillus almallahensis]NIK12594.1 hypothetical protein [Alkalibacillus almallahensis]